MKRTDAAVKVKTKATEKVNVNTEVNKVAIGTLAVAAGLVGAWVITAFVGGLGKWWSCTNGNKLDSSSFWIINKTIITLRIEQIII